MKITKLSLIFILAAFLADIITKNMTKSLKVNQHLYELFWVTEGQKVQLQAAAGGQGLSRHDADPGDSQVRKTCVAASWCQAMVGLCLVLLSPLYFVSNGTLSEDPNRQKYA